jgi:outer membrane phospholipase A
MKKQAALSNRVFPVLGFGFLLAVLFAFLPCAHAYVDETQPSLERFSGYKPMYFLFGSNHSKFQFSFKAKIVESFPLYFAYTQTSFWDVFRYSAPFLDTTYAPEIFYRNILNSDKKTWLDYGVFHESNGRDGDASRAWNRFYLRYSRNENFGETHWSWSAQAWLPIETENQSKDLPKYRGIYEFIVTWADFLGEDFDRDDLSLRLYPGGSIFINPFLGGQEITFRFKNKSRKFLPLFLVQMFHGYGESMLDYKTNTWVARVGIGF